MKEGGRIVVATASATFGLYGVRETMKIPCGMLAAAVGVDRHDISEEGNEEMIRALAGTIKSMGARKASGNPTLRARDWRDWKEV